MICGLMICLSINSLFSLKENMTIVLCSLDLLSMRRKKHLGSFNMWCKAEGFHDIVSKVWQQHIPYTFMFQVVSKLKLLKEDLKGLSTSQFGNVSEQYTFKYHNMILAQIAMHDTLLMVSSVSRTKWQEKNIKLLI